MQITSRRANIQYQNKETYYLRCEKVGMSKYQINATISAWVRCAPHRVVKFLVRQYYANKHRLLLTKWLNFFGANNHKFSRYEWQFPAISDILHFNYMILCDAGFSELRTGTLDRNWTCLRIFIFPFTFYRSLGPSRVSFPSIEFGVNVNWKIVINPPSASRSPYPRFNHHQFTLSACHHSANREIDESNSSNQALHLSISSSLPSI